MTRLHALPVRRLRARPSAPWLAAVTVVLLAAMSTTVGAAPVASARAKPAAAPVANAAAIAALPPEARGEAIAREAQDRGADYGDLSADAEMVVANGRGSEARRALQIRLLDLPGAASRSLTVVTAPKDVKGTTLLTHTGATGGDEQWLYLPAVGRTKRIASAGRSGPFMGSEFSYDDFSAQSAERYRFKWLRSEPCPAPVANLACDVVERRPRVAGGGSARQEVWLDVPQRRLQQVRYFDAQDAVIKTLTASGYKLYEGRFWRADELHMVNARSGATTRLIWRNIRFRQGLSEGDFAVERLGGGEP